MKLPLIAMALCAVPMCAQQQTDAPPGAPVPAPPKGAQAAPSDAAVDAPANAGPLVFRVHVADGRNGKPMAGAKVQLWYDEPTGAGTILITDARGDAAMPSPVGDPLRVLVTPQGYIDCRRPDPNAPPPGYNLSHIAEKGVATLNSCAAIAVHPQPGELVLFVRPTRWYDSINKAPTF